MADHLPPLNPLAARSTYAIGLMIASLVAQAVGFDFMAWFAAVDLGIPMTLTEKAELVVTGALGIWAWLERRAPRRALDLLGPLR